MVDDLIKGIVSAGDERINEDLLLRLQQNVAKRKTCRPQQTASKEPLFDWQAAAGGGTVHMAIEQAATIQTVAPVGLQLRPARSLIDRLLERIRRPFHELALFYLGIMDERQRSFNELILVALRGLLELAEAGNLKQRENEIAELRAEIARVGELVNELSDAVKQLKAEMK